MSGFELERLIDRRLRALPALAAPPSLLPRVMSAARAWAARPWYAREWLTWPLGWQVGSVALMAALFTTILIVTPAAQATLARAASSAFSTIAVDVPQIAGSVQSSTSVMRVLWRVLVQPFLPYAFAIVMIMCAATAMVVLALNRVVFGKALHS